MPDFTRIEKVHFPKHILEESFEFLREAGLKGYEAVTLFAGNSKENEYHISHLYIPVQESYKTPEGLMYHVSTDELAILDDWLFNNQLSLFCQMHTHPSEAYHSLADDMNCIVTATGGVSIVVPDFAKHPIHPSNWAIYRLQRNQGWVELDRSKVSTFISLI